MNQNYIFFTRNTLPQPEAHLVHDVNTANAAANLGYPAILVYLNNDKTALNPVDWFYPFRPKKPSQELIEFYNIQDRLKVIPLAMPSPIDEKKGKWLHPSTWVCKYYFPRYIFPHTKILHTLDWNLVKTAIKAGIPVIYEREHDQKSKYEPEIVKNPLFQVAITVADSVRENMIENGMPPEKIVKLHLSFNRSFLERNLQEVQQWRRKLVESDRQYLVVYSGGLYKFKGVDLLIDVAQTLPHIQFVFAGGSESQLQQYRQLVRDKRISNVTFLGYVKHCSLPSLLQAADLLAHPHCSGEASIFTSPLKFFEYLASGTPIVATEILPLLEFKNANIPVSWCEPDNPVSYADCLQKALDLYPRKVDGYSTQMDFARQFSWENRVDKIMNYVSESLRPSIVN